MIINPNVLRIRDYAIRLNNTLNTTTSSNSMLTVEYTNLLKEIAKHPTNGFLIKHQYVDNSGFKNKGHRHACNVEFLKNSKEVIDLRNEIIEKINTLYPKTKILRKYIIMNGRVTIDYVKQKKGYSLANKIGIFFQKLHDNIKKPFWG